MDTDKIRRFQQIEMEMDFYKKWIKRFEGDIRRLKNEKKTLEAS